MSIVVEFKYKNINHWIPKDKKWVAYLSCGHSRHFRHNPLFQIREWVTSSQGRNTYIGFELECRLNAHWKWIDYAPSEQHI